MTELTVIVNKEKKAIDKAVDKSIGFFGGLAALDTILFVGWALLMAFMGMTILVVMFLRWCGC